MSIEGSDTPAGTANESLLFFLQYGGLRWEQGYEGRAIEEQVAKVNPVFLDRLSAIVGRSDDALNRLFHNFTVGFKQRVVDAICVQLSPTLCKLVVFLSNQRIQGDQPSHIIILAYTVYHTERKTSDSSFAALVTLLFWSTVNDMATKQELVTEMIKFIERNHLATKLFQSDITWRRVVLSYVLQVVPTKANRLYRIMAKACDENTGKEKLQGEGMENYVIIGNERIKQMNGRKMDIDQMKPEVDAMYIDNAGLVIIHPFIQSLFETVGLFKSGYRNTEIDRLAPVVLQYVLRGDNHIKESDLPLNKILCGLAPATFLPCEVELSAGCIQACDELLSVVIGHWSALKNMSIARLRETFLQRKGKLVKSEMGWRLYVEPKGVDMLLSSLPWDMDISTIKLPWMDECLVVEWGTTIEQDALVG